MAQDDNGDVARLISAPAASRYLHGERPERWGVKPIKGKRQRLYDLRAIDAALDQHSGLQREAVGPNSPLDCLSDEWR